MGKTEPDWAAIHAASKANRDARFAKMMRRQEERQRRAGSHNRAAMYLGAARRFKRKNARWPFPVELREGGWL